MTVASTPDPPTCSGAQYARNGVSNASTTSTRGSLTHRRSRSITQLTQSPQMISPTTMAANVPTAALIENAPALTAATAKR